MSGVGFTVKGSTGLEDLKKQLYDRFGIARYASIMKEAAQVAYDEAYRLCPVADSRFANSGKMKGNIYVEYDGYLTFSLSCDVPYASFNEYGWRGIPPVPDPPATVFYVGGYRPFMRIGILKAQEFIDNEVKRRKAQ